MAAPSSPKISVIINTYNFEKYLEQCIESILAQTLPPYEIIISDDCSSDESWEIISHYSRQYPDIIRSFRRESNMGPKYIGNFSYEKVRGELISVLDGDDRWLPRKLEMEWKALQEHPEAKIAYSNVYTIDTEGNRTGVWLDENDPPPPSGEVFVEVFSRRFFPGQRSIFRNHLMYRAALEEAGYLDASLDHLWDWDEKVRLTSKFKVAYSAEALVEYRIHPKGIHTQEPDTGILDVYEKNLPLLKNRSSGDKVKVSFNIESFIASKRLQGHLDDRASYYLACNVFKRNLRLLEEIPQTERGILKNELLPAFLELRGHIIYEKLGMGEKKAALKYWVNFGWHHGTGFAPRLLLAILLPASLYERLRGVYRFFGFAWRRFTQKDKALIK